MCEQTEINYLDGDVVWVKLGTCWWPGQVIGLHNLPDDIQNEFQKKPIIAAVKFFQEDTYEFVKNYQQIYKYNCTQKDEFIKKGLDKYRSKSKDGASYMNKFPGDVEMAEKLTDGDPDILNRKEFCPEEKPDISALFGEKKLPRRKRDRDDLQRRSDGSNTARKITHPRFLSGESDHEVRIRQQPSSSAPLTPTSTGSPQYFCHFCGFTSSRINVIICHQKIHRSEGGGTPKIKTYSQSRRLSDASTPKRKYIKKDKSQLSKKKSDSEPESRKRKQIKQSEKISKKKKTDPELREKLLADWDDESDEENVTVNSSLNNSSFNGSPTKNQSSIDNNSELNENDGENDNNEIITESEKLLKETEELSSVHIHESLDSLHTSKSVRLSSFDRKCESEKDIKASGASSEKSPKKSTLSSDNDNKNSSSTDDKKSRLSCFDFDEDDLSEPSIPPVRKIPRVFGEKNLSLKKEIIKEFELSQALKNEIKKESELVKNMGLKADEIMEIIQGSDYIHEKKETKASEKSDESVHDKVEVKQSEGKTEKKTVLSAQKNQQQKSSANACETDAKVTEKLEVEKEDRSNDLASSAKKDIDKNFKTTAAEASVKSDETSGKKDEMPANAAKAKDGSFQPEKVDSGNTTVKSNESIFVKEADDTLSERFTTETEDETVSESAETVPEQSENSDVDMDRERNVDNSFSGNRVTQMVVKRGRGRPRKNAKSASRGNSADKTPRAKENKNKRFRANERIEIEPKASDSDTDRSYSGRKRKPNKKYLGSDIYVQNPDYKAFRTDESQSESDDKVSERIKSRSKRGRRPKNTKSSELVTRTDKREIEIADQTAAIATNNDSISSIDTKYETPVSKETLLVEEKHEETKRDVLKESVKPLDKAAETDVSTKDVDVPMTPESTSRTNEVKIDLDETVAKPSKMLEKEDSVKSDKRDTRENATDGEKLIVTQRVENESETHRDISKTNVDMLPPKKSQIKKFELSQIDTLDTDVQINKTVSVETETELKIGSESEHQPRAERQLESKHPPECENDNGEKTDKKNETEVKAKLGITDEIAKFLNTESKESKKQISSETTQVEKKSEKSSEKTVETQSIEKILEKTEAVDHPELKSPEKSSSTDKSDSVEDTLKSVAKLDIEQPTTPKKSVMQTRYKGKFTPETGAKGKKDKDFFLEEKPINTFQEAFLKTLQIDKKKVAVDDGEMSPKGKKGKKVVKKKTEEIANVTAALNATSNESSKGMQVLENIPIEGSSVLDISVMSNLENMKVVVEDKPGVNSKIGDIVFEAGQLGSLPGEFVIVPNLSLQSSVSENTVKSISDLKKEDTPKTTQTVATSSLSSSDISVPVKKREMPRIIENVTLTEPVQILKTKLLDKLPQKSVKHKLEVDAGAKKGDSKGNPKAKIMKIEALPSDTKVKTPVKSSPTGSSHMSLNKKLQILKSDEKDTILETQKEKQNVPTTQTLVTAEKYIQQSSQSLADMELDINSMPFVLSEDVLTPENIEQMPVVISSIIPASSTIPTTATISFTSTTQIGQTTQFKLANETASETVPSPTKKKSGMPAILKNKKARPTITSVKTLVPPLTGGVKGLKFQSAQPVSNAPSLLTQKGTVPGKYVVVQTAGGQQLRYSVQGKAGTQQQKIAIPTSKSTTGNAQVVHQGGKVVILTSAQSCQPKMVPLNISKTLSGKMQRIMTSKGQVLCPISPQGSIISKKVIAPKTDASSSPTTSKLPTSGHKIINTQSIITSKGVLTPITGKTALLGTLSQGIITKDGIYTPISASALSGKTIIGSKTLVTKGTTLLSPQSIGGGKAILTPVSQTIAGKTAILGTQTIVGGKGTVLTPITGQQVKAIAAKSPTKANKMQYHQPVQQKMQIQPILQKSSKVPISSASPQARTSGSLKSTGNTLVLQNTIATQKSTSHGKKATKQATAAVQGVASPSGAQQAVAMMQTAVSQIQPKGSKTTATVSNVQKVIIPRATGRQMKTQQKIMVQKLQEPAVPAAVQAVHAKQTSAATPANLPIATKAAAHTKQTTPTKSLVKSHASAKAQNQAQKNLLNVGVNSIATATTNVANIVTTLALPPLEPIDAEKKVKTELQLIDAVQKEQSKYDKNQSEKSGDAMAERVEETKPVATQPQIMALPTESSDGTQTYVLVTIDEQGQIQPLDNNTLMSLEGTTQNPDGTRTLYIDPSSLGETGTLDNIVLQFDNGILPNIQASVTTEPSQTIISESYSAPEMMQTSNQDILAAALANTDFQQEMSLSENQTGSVMTTGLTQTSLINQTILQSTIIPPTEPISSPSVLETSLTLNQPIMTPLEVPSNLPIQSDSTSTSSSVVPTIPASLELPITITNPSISYISTGEAQIQIPGNSMPDIGEIMESSVTGGAEMDRTEEIPASTQYLVIPNLEDNAIATAETQSVQNTKITVPSATYSVTMSNSIVLEGSQVQTTPSMPIIDDTYTDSSQFGDKSVVAEQTFVDVPVSDLISKAAVENIQSQNITVTSDMIVSSHQSSASSQKSIDKVKSSDKEQAITIREDYSSHEIPVTSEELILQQPLKETSASASGVMKVTQKVEAGDKEIIQNKSTLVTSESDSRVKSMERMDFDVTDSNELKDASGSHKAADMADELKQMTFSDRSSDKANSMVDQHVVATSNQLEATSQVLPTESLNQADDAAMEADDETAVTGEVYAGSSMTTKRSADCPRDEPSSQEGSIKSRFEEDTSTEATAAASQEAPSQSYEQFGSVSVTSDSADLPSQSATKSSESSAEATQSIAYEPMETDEVETVVTEPPTQSFEHAKVNEASQSYETSAEANVNAPTQSFNEIMQSKEDRSSADETIDDQSFPTQSYEVDKGENVPENLETDAEISQEGNVPSQSNDIGADGIGTSSVSTNNSGLNEDETASSSYVPETPENQERDQEDQESAISTSSYEIPPCEELNIASSSVIPDTSVSAEHSNIHDNGVPEIPTSSYNLNPDITSTHVDSGPTSSYEDDRVIVEQNVSTSYEVPISMPGLDETCSQNFVTESTDHRNEPSSYYAHHQEVTASYYEPMDQDANSRLEGGDPHEEVTPGYYEGNPQEVSQSYFAPAEETPSYTSHSISPSYYDPRPESEASQSYYSTDDLDKTEQSSSPNIEASQSFYQERSGELRLRQQGEATPTYPEGYPVDYTLENSPIERHDLVESSVPATRPMER